MTALVTINSVAEAAKYYTGQAPDHPLIHIVDLSKTQVDEQLVGTKVCSNLYAIAVKSNFCVKIRYGRQHYDFSSGVLTAYAPGQVIEVSEMYQLGEIGGWYITFHPDLLLQHPLGRAIKQYGYFSYEVFEALHLSEREQQTLQKLVDDIGHETRQNHDQFSLDIILSNLDLILKYIDRYFNRQFLTRKSFNFGEVERFTSLVDEHLARAEMDDVGLPSVNALADKLNMSPNYLSDLLKTQTGKSAQELIHQQLIEKAKYLLLNSEDSVASIAYKLGFEYPQYFSRIFKKKTTLTPAEFRKVH